MSSLVAVLLVMHGCGAAGHVIRPLDHELHHQSRSSDKASRTGGIMVLVRRMLYSNDAYSYEDEYGAEDDLGAGGLGPMLPEAAAASPVTAGGSARDGWYRRSCHAYVYCGTCMI